ncbi:Dimethyladenosine transferase 1, mitochondrial [Actinomortierella wolfii]|nr:Dimethyladenosine transferase 1, mitochondrial [Actinomortierella wolfii]
MIPHKLPPLPPIRDLIRIYGLSAKQKFSQNFILDRNVTDAIVQRAKVSPADDLVVEVGPDAGPKRVVVVEKDTRFVPALEQLVEASDHRLGIAMGDMLTLQHSQIYELAKGLNQSAGSLNDHDATVRLLGNLPFGVASPLLIQWLKMMALREGLFRGNNRNTMTLMFQKEVAEAICAPPNDPQRGRLSVMAQSICDVKLVYKLSASVFVPKPKVDAAVVHFEPKASPLMTGSLDKLEDVTRFFFNKRRKTMGHNTNRLAKAMPEVAPLLDQWQAQGKWDMSIRSHEVSTEQFCALARLLDQEQLKIPLT